LLTFRTLSHLLDCNIIHWRSCIYGSCCICLLVGFAFFLLLPNSNRTIKYITYVIMRWWLVYMKSLLVANPVSVREDIEFSPFIRILLLFFDLAWWYPSNSLTIHLLSLLPFHLWGGWCFNKVTDRVLCWWWCCILALRA